MGEAADGPPPRRSGAEVDPHGPDHVVVHEGYTYLLSRLDGSIGGNEQEGLFDFDTRLLSRYRLRIDGRAPTGTGIASAAGDTWTAVLRIGLPGGEAVGPHLPQDALGVRVERRVGRGMRERLDVTNHTMRRLAATLELEVGGDFVDLLALGSDRRVGGAIDVEWDVTQRRLEYRYTARHDERSLERGVRVTLADGWDGATLEAIDARHGPQPARAHRVRLALELAPGVRRELGTIIESLVDGKWRTPSDDREARRDAARRGRPTVEAPGDLVAPLWARAADDLVGLRNWDLETVEGEWLVNAGVPQFTGFFGRDSLTAGLQAAMFGPELMRGALAHAAATQGRRSDDFSEEQPGRMIHEMRRGPLADLGIRPHRAYYGTSTTGSIFVTTLSELWHWTGERTLLERYVEPARRAIEWADRDGDLDGDGLLEYEQRSPEGLKNQGWKDSDEAIRYPDGRIVPNPIATIDEQAFHYIALVRMAEIQTVLEDDDGADRCIERAARLRREVDERFWMADERSYAVALDPQKRQVTSVTSNPIHALGAGLVPPERARAVAERLLEPDLFNGWGVRTLSANHPSYNPFGYHLGAVWPVEAATFAVGAKRYGLDDVVDRIATGLYGAAGHCQRLRLPEAFAGHGPADSPVPVMYPGAKSPQAWSASAPIQLLQVMLGLQPFAAVGTLALVRPRLPAWLPELTIRRLRVGEARIDLRFERRTDGTTAHEVLALDGDLRVIEVPPPSDVAPQRPLTDRAAAWALAHAPGRVARAIRIAMGVDDRLQ